MELADCPEKSDRMIADHCGVAHSFVNKIRDQLFSENSSDAPDKTIGKDGKARPTRHSRPDDDLAFLDEPDEPQEPEEDESAEEIAELAEPYKRAVQDLLRIKRDMKAILDDRFAGGHLRLSCELQVFAVAHDAFEQSASLARGHRGRLSVHRCSFLERELSSTRCAKER